MYDDLTKLIKGYNEEPALFGLTTKGTLGDLGQAAGLAGTLAEGYSNLFGDNHDLFKLKKSALKQNMANIDADRANHQKFVDNFGGGINSAFKGGLAASAATPK